jgi:hypothetical protein
MYEKALMLSDSAGDQGDDVITPHGFVKMRSAARPPARQLPLPTWLLRRLRLAFVYCRVCCASPTSRVFAKRARRRGQLDVWYELR